jgi:hypothetical protein
MVHELEEGESGEPQFRRSASQTEFNRPPTSEDVFMNGIMSRDAMDIEPDDPATPERVIALEARPLPSLPPIVLSDPYPYCLSTPGIDKDAGGESVGSSRTSSPSASVENDRTVSGSDTEEELVLQLGDAEVLGRPDVSTKLLPHMQGTPINGHLIADVSKKMKSDSQLAELLSTLNSEEELSEDVFTELGGLLHELAQFEPGPPVDETDPQIVPEKVQSPLEEPWNASEADSQSSSAAAAAELVNGEGEEKVPAVLTNGDRHPAADEDGRDEKTSSKLDALAKEPAAMNECVFLYENQSTFSKPFSGSPKPIVKKRYLHHDRNASTLPRLLS